jgi:hypothetical protein
MSDPTSRSWDDVVDSLRGAAADLRSTAGRPGAPSAAEEAAAARLKSDVSRLEESAAKLRSTFAQGLEAQKSEIEASLDKEKAEQSTAQLRASLEELASMAKTVAGDLKSAAGVGFEQAEPDLKTAIRSLEDVAGSAAAWVRAALDPDRSASEDARAGSKPPLETM